jgi:hypothetical protein
MKRRVANFFLLSLKLRTRTVINRFLVRMNRKTFDKMSDKQLKAFLYRFKSIPHGRYRDILAEAYNDIRLGRSLPPLKMMHCYSKPDLSIPDFEGGQ